MTEWLHALLHLHPRAFIFFGRGMVSLAGAMAILGLRFGKLGEKLERISARAGVEPPDVMAGLPWWLRLFVPETTSGWVGVALILAIGGWMALAGKQAKKARW